MHEDNYGVYGSRKVHAEMVRRGHKVARCTVARLMAATGLRGLSRAKGPRTTVPGTGPDARPDLVRRGRLEPALDQVRPRVRPGPGHGRARAFGPRQAP